MNIQTSQSKVSTWFDRLFAPAMSAEEVAQWQQMMRKVAAACECGIRFNKKGVFFTKTTSEGCKESYRAHFTWHQGKSRYGDSLNDLFINHPLYLDFFVTWGVAPFLTQVERTAHAQSQKKTYIYRRVYFCMAKFAGNDEWQEKVLKRYAITAHEQLEWSIDFQKRLKELEKVT